MKYIIRAVKYFFYFAFLTSAIVVALVLIGAVEGNIESIFEGGYNALWKMAAFFAAVAAVYPSLAFIKKDINGPIKISEAREDIVEYMKARRYVLESETDGVLAFRCAGIMTRLTKMFEDKIVIKQGSDGIQIEGLRKDVLRFAAGLETLLVPPTAVE